MNEVNVRALRKELRLNQVEFAQLAGVHPITVSKWERKEAEPTAYQNVLFAQFLEGSRDKEVRETLKNVLIGAGIALAIALLLRHLLKK
jgi:transcriptional regulator with XRE-family HTH domain